MGWWKPHDSNISKHCWLWRQPGLWSRELALHSGDPASGLNLPLHPWLLSHSCFINELLIKSPENGSISDMEPVSNNAILCPTRVPQSFDIKALQGDKEATCYQAALWEPPVGILQSRSIWLYLTPFTKQYPHLYIWDNGTSFFCEVFWDPSVKGTSITFILWLTSVAKASSHLELLALD